MPSARPARITHVVFDLQGGGLESMVAAMARYFAHRPRVRMSVISLSGRAGRVGESIRSVVHDLDVEKPVRGLSMILPRGLIKTLRKHQPDIVHLHSGAWYKGALAARLAGVPAIIYTEHGREHADPWLARWIDGRALAWTDVVVPVSERLSRYMATRLHVPTAKLHVIENGVDLERFSPGPAPDDLRQGLEIPPDAFVVGSVGRLEPVKGYARLVEVFGHLRASGALPKPAYLILCGDGSERGRLLELGRQQGVQDFLRLPGWVADPVPYYRLFDVFVLSSHSEGHSVSLLEAMACGAAPAVTDVGANRAILGANLAGQVVPPDGMTILEEVIARSLGSADARRRLGVAARDRVGTAFGVDRTAAAYEALYLSLATRSDG